ncbi:hypothetical protein C4K35_4117 [Pseudomonas chlororaphis subsp. piscium]|uniref:SpaN/EivJ family type III secretion system needle length determinant n=1 Tax=Pseudomonas chlororaphis TaxID=587753 RepID=UPI000F6D0A95|nr:hypothetical protein [Pseudomonas chlororaphis]AZC51696.1 hypothetical protein C4K35_4117 [Pseudomonas chlororaphis subsp. piscium]
MSIMSPPITVTSPINALLPGDEFNEKNELPISDDFNELDELPQGALVLLAQFQPLREHAIKLSLGSPSPGPAAAPMPAMVPVLQARHLAVKKPLVSSSPVLVNGQLALQAARPLADTRGHVPMDSAPSSASSLGALTTQVVGVSSMPAPVKPDQAVGPSIAEADADVSVKQEPLQPLAAQPLPLMDKLLGVQLAMKQTAPAKAAPEPVQKPEFGMGKGASNYLQVPFNKGDAAGLITISKVGAEYPDQLLLNPNSASIFGHLSDSLAQTPDPRWRLADQQGHEHGNGHDQERPDEEAEEGNRQAFQDKRQQERQDA